MDRALRAENSSMRMFLLRWLGSVCGAHHWTASAAAGALLLNWAKGEGFMGICEYAADEQCSCNVLFSVPVVDNIYYTGAGKVNRLPHVAGRTFTSQGENNSREVGLGVLSTTGWKPGWAPSQLENTTGVLPLGNKNGNLKNQPEKYGLVRRIFGQA